MASTSSSMSARDSPNLLSHQGSVLTRNAMSSHQELNAGCKVELWQAEASTEAGTDDLGIVSRLTQACLDSMFCLMRTTELSGSDQNSLLRCRATLKLWASGHRVRDGKLDRILERSRGLQHTMISILNSFCKVLSDGLKRYATAKCNDADIARVLDSTAQIYSQTKWLLCRTTGNESNSESDGDSDSESDNEEDCAFEQLVEDIKTHLNCLMDLSPALECPAVDPQEPDEPSMPRVEQRAAHDYHADLILAKFPKAHIDLIESLGRTSWSRYRRMQQEREQNTNTQAHPLDREHVEFGAKSILAISEFQDSGLGTSLPSAPPTRYAETVISFMTSIAGGKRIHIPPLPAQAKSGASFECNACGRHIRALNNREWRKHLYLDLKPYTCFFASCSFSSVPFSDRYLWSRHLELDHRFGPSWDSIECPLCLERTDVGKSKILIHFARHMEDIALAALPRDIESDGESDEGSHANRSSIRSMSDRDDYNKDAITSEKQDDSFLKDLIVERGTVVQQSNSVGKSHLSILEQAKQEFWDNNKDVSEEQRQELWLTTASAVPLDALSTTRSAMSAVEVALSRCKVLQRPVLEKSELDMGLIRIAPDSRGWWMIEVQSESTPERKLFSTFLTLDNTFRKRHETLIACKGRNGADVDLYFQDVEGCALAWNIIRRLQKGQEESARQLQEVVHSSRVPDTYWSLTELRDFRTYVRENGTNWAAIASKLASKTSDMVHEQYTRDVEQGDTELELMAQEADDRMRSSKHSLPTDGVKQHWTTSQQPAMTRSLFCPWDHCKDSSGIGFEGMGMLAEHIDRVHRTTNKSADDTSQLRKLQGHPTPQEATFDQFGQISPSDARFRVSRIWWEQEKCFCWEIHAKGVVIARREDNNMINGTKLLSATGMTRGRRDGILKSGIIRHVTRVGPAQFRGVWIPFEHALELAKQERITEEVYPLFQLDLEALAPAISRVILPSGEQDPIRLESSGNGRLLRTPQSITSPVPALGSQSPASCEVATSAREQLPPISSLVHDLPSASTSPKTDSLTPAVHQTPLSPYYPGSILSPINSMSPSILPDSTGDKFLRSRTGHILPHDIIDGPPSWPSKVRSPDPNQKPLMEILEDREADPPIGKQQSPASRPSGNMLHGNDIREDLATLGDDNDIIRCICSSIDDDGNTVLCEMCGSWQHIICFYESARDVPSVHLCLDCSPRSIDRNSAAQRRRRQRQIRDQTGQQEPGKGRHPTTGRAEQDAGELFVTRPLGLENLMSDTYHQIDPPKNSSFQTGNTKATGARAENAPVYYTRTGRISKAKKGLKTHNCECGRSYTRAEHLRRHQKMHDQDDALVCQIDGCSKTFYRADLLHKHQERHREVEMNKTSSSREFLDVFGDITSTSLDPPTRGGHQAGHEQQPAIRPQTITTDANSLYSCDSCRRFSLNCDFLRPTCATCKKSSTSCSYSLSQERRKTKLSAEQRERAKNMRRIGTCTNCVRRLEKCDPDTPCRSCIDHYRDDLINHPCERRTPTGNVTQSLFSESDVLSIATAAHLAQSQEEAAAEGKGTEGPVSRFKIHHD